MGIIRFRWVGLLISCRPNKERHCKAANTFKRQPCLAPPHALLRQRSQRESGELVVVLTSPRHRRRYTGSATPSPSLPIPEGYAAAPRASSESKLGRCSFGNERVCQLKVLLQLRWHAFQLRKAIQHYRAAHRGPPVANSVSAAVSGTGGSSQSRSRARSRMQCAQFDPIGLRPRGSNRGAIIPECSSVTIPPVGDRDESSGRTSTQPSR
jgi:hypothetical protein